MVYYFALTPGQIVLLFIIFGCVSVITTVIVNMWRNEMKTVQLIYTTCPCCGAEIREGVFRCHMCGNYLYWKKEGKRTIVEKRTSSPQWPKTGIVRFRKGMLQVAVRKAPDEQAEQSYSLAQEQQVKVVADKGDYYQLEDGLWVHHYCIDIRLPIGEDTKYGRLNKAGSGYHSVDRPEAGAKILRPLRPGATVDVLEESNGFYQIGEYEWVWSGFVDVK